MFTGIIIHFIFRLKGQSTLHLTIHNLLLINVCAKKKNENTIAKTPLRAVVKMPRWLMLFCNIYCRTFKETLVSCVNWLRGNVAHCENKSFPVNARLLASFCELALLNQFQCGIPLRGYFRVRGKMCFWNRQLWFKQIGNACPPKSPRIKPNYFCLCLTLIYILLRAVRGPQNKPHLRNDRYTPATYSGFFSFFLSFLFGYWLKFSIIIKRVQYVKLILREDLIRTGQLK